MCFPAVFSQCCSGNRDKGKGANKEVCHGSATATKNLVKGKKSTEKEVCVCRHRNRRQFQ